MIERNITRTLIGVLFMAVVSLVIYVFQDATKDRYTATDSERDLRPIHETLDEHESRLDKLDKEH